MSEKVVIELDRAAVAAFLPLAEEAVERLGNRGCNDHALPDTPENRQLVERVAAWNAGVSLADWLKHEDYCKPQVYRGQLLTADFPLLGYVVAQIRAQAGMEAHDGA